MKLVEKPATPPAEQHSLDIQYTRMQPVSSQAPESTTT